MVNKRNPRSSRPSKANNFADTRTADEAQRPAEKQRPARIVKTRGVCGGNARIRGTRIPVWGIESARRNGCDDFEILSMFPDLSTNDLRAACEYAASHAAEIDRQISENIED